MSLSKVAFAGILFSLLIPALPASAATNKCLEIFEISALERDTNPTTSKANASVNLSTAERMNMVFEALPAEARAQLFASLKALTRPQILSILEKNEIPPSIKSAVEANPQLEQILVDFVSFSESFPVLQLDDSEMWTMKVLKSITAQEKRPTHSNDKLLESQSSGPALRRTINGTIVNLIQRATVEYKGMKFENITGWRLVWHRVKRFFFPLYTQVAKQVDAGQFYQRQLERDRVVDALVIRKVLTDGESKLLTDKEMEDATGLVLDTPKQFSNIEKSLQKIFGSTFAIGKNVAINDIDIYRGTRGVEEQDLSGIQDEFETNNVNSLDKLQELINAQREKNGREPRKLSEKDVDELRIYHEAQNRRLWRWEAQYEGWTTNDTNESYTVEDRQTRQVEDGKDSEGKTKYKTEVYYTDRSVTPSFENLLTGQFDTGDRSVSGLDRVKENARRMVDNERPSRNVANGVEDFINGVLEEYVEMVTKGTGLDKARDHIKDYKKEVLEFIAIQKQYANMTNQQILSQYRNDNVENFKARNAWMLERLENMHKELVILEELIRRKELQLTLSFDEMDLSNWMLELKRYRNWNYTMKAAMGLTTTATGVGVFVYNDNPAFAHWVNENAPFIVDMFSKLTGN